MGLATVVVERQSRMFNHADIGEELWRRAPMAERRGAAERRRRLERERCEDEADALREKEEDEVRDGLSSTVRVGASGGG